MVHLDTSALIALADAQDPHREKALLLMENERLAGISALAWWEFLCGPVTTKGVAVVRNLLGGGIVPFGQIQAHKAAWLFNAVGRSRRLKFDALIAATAILSGAELASANEGDFELFVPHGLRLRPL